MKRFLCILLCLTLFAPAALAATDVTPMKKFRQQIITGGNGLRGTLTLSASGVAEWVELLSPFTAATLNLRAIGEQQGEKSALVPDDDDWQIKLYVKDAEDNQRAVTYLYGTPEGMWFQSELLPDVLLTLPVQNVQLLYQLIDGELPSLLTSLDPLSLNGRSATGNERAYSALAELLQIKDEEGEQNWEPVMAKYYTEMDMWLSLYAAEPVVSGSTGNLTMSSVYTIPAEDLKVQAKYIMGRMIYDAELQNLLLPYVTMEQRMLYLNPSLIYYYEYCIDAMPLKGNIILKREMTAKGETTSMSVSLPLTQLPEDLTAPAGKLLADIFSLPYTNIFSELERITLTKSGDDVSINLASPQRSISLIVDEAASNAESMHQEGFIRITPAVGNDEPPLSASFTYKAGRKLWEDEEWVKHEDFYYLLSAEPDFSLTADDDPFRSSYLDFPPVSVEADLAYSLETDKSNRPVDLDIRISAILPDAEISLTADLRTGNPWEHETLPVSGGEELLTMTDERCGELKTLLMENAIHLMSSIHGIPAIPEAESETAAEATAVPAAE